MTDQDTGISGHIGYPTRNLSRAERWGPRQLCLSAPQALSHPVHCPSSPCCVCRINSHRIHYCTVDDPFLVLGMSVKGKARTDVKALPRTERTVGTRATWSDRKDIPAEILTEKDGGTQTNLGTCKLKLSTAALQESFLLYSIAAR